MTRAGALAVGLRLVPPVRRRVPQRREVALEVHPDHRVPLVLGRVDEHPVAHEAGVVDQHVEAAERLDRLRDHRLGVLEVGHVGTVRDRPAAHRLDLGDHLVGGLSRAFSPASETPKSLTTTVAPWRASSSACSRPRPRPAPVTIAIAAFADAVTVLRGGSLVRRCWTCRKTGASPPPWHSTVAPRDVGREVGEQERRRRGRRPRGEAIRPSGTVRLDRGDPVVTAVVLGRAARCGTARRRSSSTRTLGAHSTASDRVSVSRPAFAAPYAAVPGEGAARRRCETLTIDPPPLLRLHDRVGGLGDQQRGQQVEARRPWRGSAGRRRRRASTAPRRRC